MHSQSNPVITRLDQLSAPVQERLKKAGFDLSREINQFQNIKKIKSNALFYSIAQHDMDILKELLHAGVDLNVVTTDYRKSCLMQALCQENYAAFEFILDHPRAQTINFNHCIDDAIEEDSDTLRGGTILKNVILAALNISGLYKQSECRKYFSKLLTCTTIDLNYSSAYTMSAFAFLLSNFNQFNDLFPDQVSYFKEITQEFLAAGVKISSDSSGDTIGTLFDLDIYELDEGEVMSSAQEHNLLIMFNLLFNQLEYIDLTCYTDYESEGNNFNGRFLDVAVCYQLDTIVSKLLSEIRVQVLQAILDNIIVIEEDRSYEEALKGFISDHATDANQKKLLAEKVFPFAFKMTNPQKCLQDIVYSEKIQAKLANDGFNLAGGFKQQHANITLLNYAAQHGLKGLIICMALQPSFSKDYNEKELSEALITSISARHFSIVRIITSIFLANNALPVVTKFDLLMAALTHAVTFKNASLIQFFSTKYHELAKSHPDIASRYFDIDKKQDNAYAQFKVGMMLEHGLGTLKDEKKSVEFYNKAAGQKYDPAIYCLAAMYASGRGAERSEKKAAALLKLVKPSVNHVLETKQEKVDVKTALQQRIHMLEAMRKEQKSEPKKPQQPSEIKDNPSTKELKKKKERPKPKTKVSVSAETLAPLRAIESKASATIVNNNIQPELKLHKLHERANTLIEELYAGNKEKIAQEKVKLLDIKTRPLLKDKVTQLQQALSQKEGHGENPKKSNRDDSLDQPKSVSVKETKDVAVADDKKKEQPRNPYAGKSQNEKRKLKKANQAKKAAKRRQQLIEQQKQAEQESEEQRRIQLHNNALRGTITAIINEKNPRLSPAIVLEEFQVLKPVDDAKAHSDMDLPEFSYAKNSLKPLHTALPLKPQEDKKKEAPKLSNPKTTQSMHLDQFHVLVSQGMFAANGSQPPSAGNAGINNASSASPKSIQEPANTGDTMYNVNAPGIFRKKSSK